MHDFRSSILPERAPQHSQVFFRSEFSAEQPLLRRNALLRNAVPRVDLFKKTSLRSELAMEAGAAGNTVDSAAEGVVS
jgi:hypothetical protein